MNRLTEIGAIVIVALSAMGCSVTEVSQKPPVTESPVPTIPDSSDKDPEPVSPTLAQIPGLTPSTNPDERLAQLQEGQRDPFSPLKATPIVLPSSSVSREPPRITEVTVKPNSSPPSVSPLPVQPIAPPPPPVEVQPIAPQVPTLQPNPNIPNPNIQPVAETIDIIPGQAIPIPILPISGAEAVKVTGVVELPDGMRAIVKAPDEPTSRYVVPGESLSNGTIRVKRIEIASSGNPIVVLEENGKEVVKTVSDRPY